MAGSGGDLAATVRARAAAAYLRDALARHPMPEAALETELLFGLQELRVVRWGGAGLETWNSAHCRGAAPDAAAWARGEPVALASLGAVNRARLDYYLATFAGHATAGLLAELPPLLDAGEPGLLLVLRRRPSPDIS